jgi:hypothetical protein
MRWCPIFVLMVVLGCSQDLVVPSVAPRAANTVVTLPDGFVVHAEPAKTDRERSFGLMERTSLQQGRGMLFIHNAPGNYPYWMYHCKIGLDIVWMDAGHRIVETSADTPPCKGKADSCPGYGGHEPSLYVLELPVGSISAHHLLNGQIVHFDAGG